VLRVVQNGRLCFRMLDVLRQTMVEMVCVVTETVCVVTETVCVVTETVCVVTETQVDRQI